MWFNQLLPAVVSLFAVFAMQCILFKFYDSAVYEIFLQGKVSYITAPLFVISQSETVSTVLISCGIKSLTRYGYDIMVTWPNLGTVNI